MSKVNHVPAGYQSAVPYLAVRGAAQAIEFYKKAFDAKEIDRMTMPDGRIGHAELKFADCTIMVNDEFPEMGGKSAETLGGSPVTLMLYVEDVDAVFQRAIAAGATAKQPPEDMFWGDRFSRLVDPFGNNWSLATHLEDVSPDEMKRRVDEAMKQAPNKAS
jgi:PhnB protein